MTTTTQKPEIGQSVVANGIRTNYLEAGSGSGTVVLIHGSGPGVTAYSNWRLVLPALGEDFHVLAPDMVGFGYSDRPDDVEYDVQTWADQTVGFMDAMGITKAHLVGNSFGGAIALRIATQHPERVDQLVLMGSMGVDFPITEGLDTVWGYEGTIDSMRNVLDFFAYSRDLVNEELAQVRYKASVEPGFQEAFSAMFPGAAAALGGCDEHPRGRDQQTDAPHAGHARARGQGHSGVQLLQVGGADRQRRPCGVLALRALVHDRAHRRLQPVGPRLLPRQADQARDHRKRRVERRGHHYQRGCHHRHGAEPGRPVVP